jgi:hypothetical protein
MYSYNGKKLIKGNGTGHPILNKKIKNWYYAEKDY